jgi:hypothetical protein
LAGTGDFDVVTDDDADDTVVVADADAAADDDDDNEEDEARGTDFDADAEVVVDDDTILTTGAGGGGDQLNWRIRCDPTLDIMSRGGPTVNCLDDTESIYEQNNNNENSRLTFLCQYTRPT